MTIQLTAPIPKLPQLLPPTGTWPATKHLWSQPELHALAVAYHSGRPLLVKGEPGVGKSQIARAAAQLLGWRFVYEVITPRFDPQDLMWRYDAVRRLADAGSKGDVADERKYISAGVLWRALDPSHAPVRGTGASTDAAEQAKPGCVLLLDEIDKADSDLPNSLLEVLANRGFSTPWDDNPGGPHGPKNASTPLLIVITSNDERELPAAFMRRCVVYEIKAPDERADDGKFVGWLMERGAAQFETMHHSVRGDAAHLVRQDRARADAGLGARPGLAEYLDLLRALNQIAPGDTDRQKRWLRDLSPYVLRKQGQDQSVDTADARDPSQGE